MRLLICEASHDQVTILGTERRYVVRDHQLVLRGYPDAVLREDVAQLLLSPFFRMPTPDEQAHFVQTEQQKGMVQE